MEKISAGIQNEETPAIDARVNSILPNLPAPAFAKKELHIDHGYVPEKSLPPTPSRPASREPDRPTRISEVARPISDPATPLLLHTALPFNNPGTPVFTSEVFASGSMPRQPRRQRTRKVVTKEIQPIDSESVAILGMSPFMPGQDSMHNQNRLVRNEVVLARHLSRLQQTYSTSESTHAHRAEDMYRVLGDHKSSIDLLKHVQSTGSIHSHPEFTALVEAHNETRKALKELTKDIASFSSTTRQSIDYLSDTVRRLTSPIPESPESTLSASHPEHAMMSVDSLSSSPRYFEKSLYTGVKRKRSTSGISPSVGVPPTSQASTSAAQSAYLSRSNSIVDDTSKEVIYGPIKDEADLLNPIAVGNDAVRGVGLSPSMIHSIRITPERPEYLGIRFLKFEYAARFVDLVPFGEHTERQAFVIDESTNANAST
ncbi:hypothetical protein CVT25_009956 [Psilocybe cyanescens]|uniref:Uncharacterized protein n=1 Tax=Psilocybe cyanescens TaxID=93625 RepID=A0A409XCV4_PSICY|nr:hypothetical protein CVT25_009956 [Psilocybe cyanescens]